MQRLLVGAAWSVVGSGFARLMALASTVIVARMLGVENFGQIALLQSTLGMVGVFAGLGVGVVATRYSAELRGRDRARLGQILTLTRRTALFGSLATVLSLALGADALAARINPSPSFGDMIALASISVLFVTMDGYNNSVLVGLEALKLSVVWSLAATLLSLPLSLGLVWIYGLQGAVGGIVVTSMLQWAFSRQLVLRQLRLNHISGKSPGAMEWSLLRDCALPALLGSAMVMPAHWICQVMLVNTSGGSVEMGVLGIGLQWFQAVNFFPLAVGRVVLPVMTDAIADGRHGQVKRLLATVVSANALVGLSVALTIALCSHWIMRTYGADDTYAPLTLSLVVVAAAVSAICASVGQVLVAMGKMWHGWAMNLGWAVAYVGSSFALLEFGAAGVAGGLLLAYVLQMIWLFAWWRRATRT